MCSSTNALTRLPSSIARSDGGGRVGIAIMFSLNSGALCGAYDPAHAGEHAEVMVGVAEQGVDHGDALEVVADLVLHGHADAAVQLDRALADDAAGAADLHLRGADRLAPLDAVLLG